MLHHLLQRAFHLPLALVLCIIISMILINLSGMGFIFLFPEKNVLASILFVSAISIVLSAGYFFKKNNTTFDPRTPEKTSSLVTEGIFRFSRNPMYVGFLLILVATAIYLANFINFLFLPLFIFLANKLYIQPEEKALTKLFGDIYIQYCQTVRRWI